MAMMRGGLFANRGSYCVEFIGWLTWHEGTSREYTSGPHLHLIENVGLSTAQRWYDGADAEGLPVRIYDHNGQVVKANMKLKCSVTGREVCNICSLGLL